MFPYKPPENGHIHKLYVRHEIVDARTTDKVGYREQKNKFLGLETPGFDFYF